MTADLTSCLNQLRDLVSKPEMATRPWTQLAEKGLLLRGLISGVIQSHDDGAGTQMEECLGMLDDHAFEQALQVALTQRTLDSQGAIRLARHARALVCTALAARAARRLIRGDITARSCLDSSLLRALTLLDNGARTAGRYRPPYYGHGARTPSTEVRDTLRSLPADNHPQIAALYWTLYWLDRADTSSPTLPDIARRTLPIWLVASGVEGGKPHQMHLEEVAESNLAQLFEHPESALLPFGDRLLDAVRQAWDRLDAPLAVCWRLPDPGALLDGDSLGGAAALAMRALADNSNYLSDFVVLARLPEDRSNSALEPVGGLPKKLAALKGTTIRTVLLGAGDTQDATASRRRIQLSDSEMTAFAGAGLELILAGNLEEGIRIARGWEDPEKSGAFQGYERLHLIYADTGGQTWQVEKDDQRWLLKHWPYTAQSESVWRTSWDRELRTLYRVCTSAKAEKSLITLKDAFVDKDHESFVMVFGAEGYETLDTLLKNRNLCRWLRPDKLAMGGEREPVWRALGALARGISLLHSQRVLHRNVCAERVYLDPQGGPSTMRLGGFEWSVRLGSQFDGRLREEIKGWAVPPECVGADARYTLDMDWYGFGMLAARCFYTVESLGALGPADLNRGVHDVIRRDTGILSSKERALLLSFLEFEADDRLCNVDEILPALDEIVSLLATGATPDDVKAPLCVIFTPRSQPFQAQLENHGFHPDPDDEFITFAPESEAHRDSLLSFLQNQFAKPVLYATEYSGEIRYYLAGERFALELVSHGFDDPPNWEFAFTKYVGPFHVPPGAKSRRLEGLKVVFLLSAAQASYYEHQNWKAYLPTVEAEPDQTSQSIVRFQRFLRYTNQLELLMRYAEVFPCKVEPLEDSPGVWKIKVTERPEAGRVPLFCEGDGGMAEFFQREQDAGSREALLTRGDELQPERREPLWTVDTVQLKDTEHPQAFIVLSRMNNGEGAKPRGDFYLRSPGYKGQVDLVERRRRAIDRLEDHTYLLKALVYPGALWMDTHQSKLNYVPDENQVDRFKQAVMKDILRSRPIYALQGPPGTGKTTLIAHLLREILKDDPAAQILVTAQAHGAVDVLRQKVTEAFHGVKFDDQPVTIRLGAKRSSGDGQPGEVEEEAERLLIEVQRQFEQNPESSIQRRWIELLEQMSSPSRQGKGEENFHAFVELIRMGANVVYCTTSAGDLEEIVDENLSYDWVVLEEAGKIHGFDLALPMQAGHRWLLVGDQDQLEPYRIQDFEFGIGRDFDTSAECISRLSRKERSLVDSDWRDAWIQMNPEDEGKRTSSFELGQFQAFSKSWLRTFECLYKRLKNVSDAKVTSREESEGAAVGVLTRQYRMHPTIGDLISETFYKKALHSETNDQNGPLPRVLHGFAAPKSIRGKAVVWVDIPWCRTNEVGRELGPPNYNRYLNREEKKVIGVLLDQLQFEEPRNPNRPLSLALLSPYSQQVSELSGMRNRLPQGMKWQETIYTRGGVEQPVVCRPSHTVDSFQGNQASVVVVSLVRNNTKGPIEGLGFLRDIKRMNVLMSRAECLLVLVGSWSFFKHQLSGFSDQNAEHLTFKPLSTAFEVLERMFRDGRAVRVCLRGNVFEKIDEPQAGGRV